MSSLKANHQHNEISGQQKEREKDAPKILLWIYKYYLALICTHGELFLLLTALSEEILSLCSWLRFVPTYFSPIGARDLVSSPKNKNANAGSKNTAGLDAVKVKRSKCMISDSPKVSCPFNSGNEKASIHSDLSDMALNAFSVSIF